MEANTMPRRRGLLYDYNSWMDFGIDIANARLCGSCVWPLHLALCDSRFSPVS